MDITALKIRDARKLLDEHKISSPELTKAYLDRISKLDGDVKSYITVTPDAAMQAAEKEDFLRSALPVAAALFLLMTSIAYIVYRIADNKNYHERWKDYDECGLS